MGYWCFSEIEYRGQRGPRPNPNLLLVMAFFKNRLGQVGWRYTNSRAVCARDHYYFIENDILVETTIRIHPETDISCLNDREMRVGHTTRTGFAIQGDELILNLFLGDDRINYIFERCTPADWPIDYTRVEDDLT